MKQTAHMLLTAVAFLFFVGTSAHAQVPISEGWGVGVDASRMLGGHAVVQVERALSPEWLWQVSAGPYVGTLHGDNPCWKGLKGEVMSGSVLSLGTLVYPAQEHKLGASWFLGMDASIEQSRIVRGDLDRLLLPESATGTVTQTREELRLVAGAQWAVGNHIAVRLHVGVGAVRERLSGRFEGEEVNSLPMARPGGVALLWRW